MSLSVLATPKKDESSTKRTPAQLIFEEFFGEEYERQFRPSIADRLHVGFLKADRASQTTQSEIPEVKALTETVQELVIEMETMTRDLHFAKQVITAKHAQDLEEAAYEFHKKLQDRIFEVERIHEDRVDVVRRSFKQQLQDALIQMASKYKKYYEEKLGWKFRPSTSAGRRRSIKMSNLEAELQRRQSVIQMMEVQMDKLRHQLESKPDATRIVMDTGELDDAMAQNDLLQAEILELSAKLAECKDTADARENKIKRLNLEINVVDDEIEREREGSKKLAGKVEYLKRELDKSHEAWKKDVEHIKSSMQEDSEGEMQKQINTQRAFIIGQEQLARQTDLENQRILEEQRARYERLLAEERQIADNHRLTAVDCKPFERTIEYQRNEIAMLKLKLQRTENMYEKKFAILRSSLHAIKDESYIRQQLQKQARTLKYASITYGSEIISPRRTTVSPLNPNRPLPAIHKTLGKQPTLPTDRFPSRPGTEIFTTGAVDSGDDHEMEEYTKGFIPLPNPPIWQKNQFGENIPSVDKTEDFKPKQQQ